jgi:hypothetical protein
MQDIEEKERLYKAITGNEPIRFVHQRPSQAPVSLTEQTASCADVYRQILSQTSRPKRKRPAKSVVKEKPKEESETPMKPRLVYACELCQIQIPVADQTEWKQARLSHTSEIAHSLAIGQQVPIINDPALTLYPFNPKRYLGYQLLKKEGWQHGRGLGANGEGHRYPIATQLKLDRLGLGHQSASKPQITHTQEDIDSASSVSPPIRHLCLLNDRDLVLPVDIHKRFIRRRNRF